MTVDIGSNNEWPPSVARPVFLNYEIKVKDKKLVMKLSLFHKEKAVEFDKKLQCRKFSTSVAMRIRLSVGLKFSRKYYHWILLFWYIFDFMYVTFWQLNKSLGFFLFLIWNVAIGNSGRVWWPLFSSRHAATDCCISYSPFQRANMFLTGLSHLKTKFFVFVSN